MTLDAMPKKEVGRRLEALRIAREVYPSQADFAAAINVETGTYNHWATGRRLIPVPAAVRVCKLTGATLDYIYRGDVSGLPAKLMTLLPSAVEAAEAEVRRLA